MRHSRPSRRSAKGSWTSASPGSPGLGRAALKDLAARHGIHPSKALGQSFLADPNLARAIVADAGIGEGDRALEVGPGLGSLTVALAATGAHVLAVELDRTLVPALREVLAPHRLVRLEVGDALKMDWDAVLPAGDWTMVSNLPYNVAVPLLVDMLNRAPRITEYLVMVQREVGERLTAQPGDDAYGAASVRVAYRARAELVRRVPADVFWPRPKVESVTVRLTPRPAPVDADRAALFRVVDEGFAERRKTMGNALRRLGLDASSAARVLSESRVEPDIRAERLGLPEFARIAETLRREGVLR
ncbi:MAG TPA: 16S rRNA (adenine(1518)-N(6)/adenine(1519)-N(6))-dimethyltransferase RsmA [Actinomycetota bacterium]|nr:16S rRNA (adenine(1518)-N(6)/adenine(1519)-N(6))-dimethyltransferase RsmA [Actinomycetota bacterium]